MANNNGKGWLIRILAFLLGSAITIIIFFLSVGSEIKDNTAYRLATNQRLGRIEHKIDRLEDKIDRYIMQKPIGK